MTEQIENGGVGVGARYRERGLRTAVWPLLQNICANTGGACNRWNRLLLGKQTGLGQRHALICIGRSCHAVVLLPVGCCHDLHG